jgi:hypothetical protein
VLRGRGGELFAGRGSPGEVGIGGELGVVLGGLVGLGGMLIGVLEDGGGGGLAFSKLHCSLIRSF